MDSSLIRGSRVMHPILGPDAVRAVEADLLKSSLRLSPGSQQLVGGRKDLDHAYAPSTPSDLPRIGIVRRGGITAVSGEIHRRRPAAGADSVLPFGCP